METRTNPENEATILEIQRMSTEDGPGIRTTVFFKGCSLKCSWCHNPESISGSPQLHWVESRCIGCQSCLDICSRHAISHSEKGVVIKRSRCEGCGTCAEECPSTALEIMGETWQLDDLVTEVIKDRAFFEKSGGGITISGGDPTLQPQFAARFLERLKEQGVQTALDTCGLCSRKALELILPYATMVLFDIKAIDSQNHRRLTGSGNEKILENLKFIGEFMGSHVHPKTLWIRTPIIPDATDSAENIRGIGEFIAANLQTGVDRWELCTFNNLCADKYHRLDMPWIHQDSDLMTPEQMEKLAEVARQSGINPQIVHWSGSTKQVAATEVEKGRKTENKQLVTPDYCVGP